MHRSLSTRSLKDKLHETSGAVYKCIVLIGNMHVLSKGSRNMLIDWKTKEES